MNSVSPPSQKVSAPPARAKVAPKRKRNRAGRPTADELARRKRKVMEVATDMFISRGYAATTLLDIAKVAGVATRTLYQHFGDKEAIFQEVIFARDMARIDLPRLEPGDDLVTALRRAAHYCSQVALGDRSLEQLRLMIAESARFPELMSTVATTMFSRFTRNVTELFAELAEAGLIPEGDHAQSAELFIDLTLGQRTVMIYFGWASATPTEANIEARIELFIKGRFGVSPPA